MALGAQERLKMSKSGLAPKSCAKEISSVSQNERSGHGSFARVHAPFEHQQFSPVPTVKDPLRVHYSARTFWGIHSRALEVPGEMYQKRKQLVVVLLQCKEVQVKKVSYLTKEDYEV